MTDNSLDKGEEMTAFDVCLVTYNSEKWVNKCFEALSKSEFDMKQIHIYVTDNNSSDSTIEKLNTAQKEYEDCFSGIDIIANNKNDGFGKGNNIAAFKGKSEWILFLNIDTEITSSALKVLDKEITNTDNRETAAFEMRQIPFESVKYYDPVTLETSWCTGAGVAISRKAFCEVGGFDESIFLYSEDVDLSWRIRSKGYRLKYVPDAVFYHYTYDDMENPAPKRSEQIGSFVGNVMLRYKFGTDETAKRRELVVRRTLFEDRNRPFRADIKKRLASVVDKKDYYREHYHNNIENNGFFNAEAALKELDEIRYGAFIAVDPSKIDNNIEFTVIVRTYRRPDLLRLTLRSLVNQTYKNFTVIVVEDGGEDLSSSVVASFQNALNIKCINLGYHGGRSKACNIGVENAETKYVCFLDDDDYFFADHLETMAYIITLNAESSFFAANAMEGKVEYQTKSDPTTFFYTEKNSWRNDYIDRETFLVTNPLPIQAFVFTKELYEEVGGVDEGLDAFEDWDLWLRMAIKTNIIYINKTTSIFKTPADADEIEKREAFLAPYRPIMADRVNHYKQSFPDFDPDEQAKRNTQEEDGFMTIGLYEESEDAPDLFYEIPHTASWRITYPIRKVANVVCSVLGKEEASYSIGPVFAKGQTLSKTEREDLVNYALSSWSWKIAKLIQRIY